MHFSQGTADDGKVLGGHTDHAAVDGPVAGDHPVARGLLGLHAEEIGPVFDEEAGLHEALVVQECLDPLPGRHLAPLVLALDGCRPPASGQALLDLDQFFLFFSQQSSALLGLWLYFLNLSGIS